MMVKLPTGLNFKRLTGLTAAAPARTAAVFIKLLLETFFKSI
jgi:hypothetical protein